MPKRILGPFEGERVVLRPLEREDLALTLSWRNQDNIRKWFLNTNVIQEEAHYAWFEKYKTLDNDFIFAILAKDLANAVVGQISLYDVDWYSGSAEFGRLMIGNLSAQGKGYAKEAVCLLIDYGFSHMGLKEIHLEVKDENEPAISIYKSAGFIETIRENGLVSMSVNLNENFK